MLEGVIKMIDEKEIKALGKYQFWKMILKKYEHNNFENENSEFCFSCQGCSCEHGGCSGCSSCRSCS